MSIPDKRQIEGSLSAFGIALNTRHDIALEMAEMLRFAHLVSVKGLNKYIETIFYDSVWCGCNFDFVDGFDKNSEEAEEIKRCALKEISQFDWFGLILHGEPAAKTLYF